MITKDLQTLKSAGLSARKAEYGMSGNIVPLRLNLNATHAVYDLAARFADGRLTTQKLLDADDEELHRMLTEVRGIGTVRSLYVRRWHRP